MFVAKFAQVSSDKFESDKNGNMPFIGEILAGKATASLINGTMFLRNGLKPNTLYACENVTEEFEGKPQVRVQIIAEVSVLEYMQLKTALGTGKLIRDEVAVDENVDAEA